jgi:hypothetical protein
MNEAAELVVCPVSDSPMSDSPSFCILPWISRFTDEQGFECLCCVANRREAKLRDNAGRFLRVDQDLTNAGLLNSPDLKAIRAGMLRGHWPASPAKLPKKPEQPVFGRAIIGSSHIGSTKTWRKLRRTAR